MGDRGHNRHGPKRGGAAMLLSRGSWVPSNRMCQNVASAEVYFRTKWHLDPSSHLSTTDMDRKFGGGGAGSPSNTMSLRLRPTSLPSDILIHPAIWPQQIWAENWGLRPHLGRGAGSPCNTMSLDFRPTSLPSGILIDPAI